MREFACGMAVMLFFGVYVPGIGQAQGGGGQAGGGGVGIANEIFHTHGMEHNKQSVSDLNPVLDMIDLQDIINSSVPDGGIRTSLINQVQQMVGLYLNTNLNAAKQAALGLIKRVQKESQKIGPVSAMIIQAIQQDFIQFIQQGQAKTQKDVDPNNFTATTMVESQSFGDLVFNRTQANPGMITMLSKFTHKQTGGVFVVPFFLKPIVQENTVFNVKIMGKNEIFSLDSFEAFVPEGADVDPKVPFLPPSEFPRYQWARHVFRIMHTTAPVEISYYRILMESKEFNGVTFYRGQQLPLLDEYMRSSDLFSTATETDKNTKAYFDSPTIGDIRQGSLTPTKPAPGAPQDTLQSGGKFTHVDKFLELWWTSDGDFIGALEYELTKTITVAGNYDESQGTVNVSNRKFFTASKEVEKVYKDALSSSKQGFWVRNGLYYKKE